jgi:hypothetical protein
MGEGLGKSGRLALVGDSPYTYVNLQNLTSAKKQVIVMRILKLVTQGEHP